MGKYHFVWPREWLYIIPIIPGKLWNRQPVLTGVVQTQYLYILVWSLGFNQLKATGSQSVGSQEAFNSSSHVSLILGKYHQMPLTMNTLEAFAGVCYCHAEMSVWIDMNSMSHPANIEYPHYGTPKWMDFNTAGFLGVQDYKAAIDSN